jgi:DNA-binding MarR family transcriptional regulator
MNGRIVKTHTLTGLAGATSDLLRALDSVRRSLAAEADLSGNELRAMAQIAEIRGVAPKQLAESLGLSPGSITAITTALADRALIVRSPQPGDRRSLRIDLTPDGHAVVERVYQDFQDAIARSARSLDEHSTAAVISALNSLTFELWELQRRRGRVVLSRSIEGIR